MKNTKTEILTRIQRGQLDIQQGIELLARLKRDKQTEGSLAALYLEPQWLPVAEHNPSSFSDLPPTVLLFDVSQQQQQLLLKQGCHRCILVTPGKSFQQISSDLYQLNPGSARDFGQLLTYLNTEGIEPNVIVHGWGKSAQCHWQPQQPAASLNLGLELGVVSLFYLTQAVMQQKWPRSMPKMIGLCDEATAWVGGTMASFARIAQVEDPRVHFRVVTVETGSTETDSPDPAVLLNILRSAAIMKMAAADGLLELRISNQGLWQRQLQEIEMEPPTLAFTQGPYLITGGMGGLGRILARFLAERHQARLALLGRSPLTESDRSFLQQLRDLGSEVEYFSADIAQSQALETVVSAIKARWDELKGVIHAAGVLEDNLIKHKDPDSFMRVLSPKVAGTVALDLATRQEPLDFFLMFSSIAAWFAQSGQADYAAANRFMDEFSQLRTQQTSQGNCSGVSLSINWPQWSGGSMAMPEANQNYLWQQFGMAVMPDTAGLQVLTQALGGQNKLVTILYGERSRLSQHLFKSKQPGPGESARNPLSAPPTDPGKTAKNSLTNYLIELVSQTSKVPKAKIDPAADLEEIGLDSIFVNAITLELEGVFGPLPKVLLYEYQSITALIDYFLTNHAETVNQMYSVQSEVLQSEGSQSEGSQFEVPQSEGNPPTTDYDNNDIAIIGMDGRYPKAANLEQFWGNLKLGRDCIIEVPRDRWDYHEFFNPDRKHKGTSYCKWGGFLQDVEMFDPLFFNISPREAETIDPQERLFMETAWSALENAGYARQTLAAEQHQVGVFVGVSFGQYQIFAAEAWTKGTFLPAYSSFWSIANRVSYVLNLTGPSLAIDTACSSSLTAVQMACESLRRQECSMAIAGGVVLNLHPSKYVALSDMQFLSSDGRCHSFGKGGDGYVPGEGVGAVILKPLRDAIAAGDHIYAVIKGGAINHGGKTNGYTVPNPRAQSAVISQALEQSQIAPDTISYVEAHGTGTALGDPIELEGLSKVFPTAKGKQYCALGSLKSNIGHLEPAAGIAALTKVVLQLKYQQLVPTLHAEDVNPNLDFADSPFYLCQQLQSWPANDSKVPRRAAISSFGAGGANAHLILEEWDREQIEKERQSVSPTAEEATEEVIVISARDAERLKVYAQLLKEYLQHNTVSLPNVARTLQIGREPFEQRLAVVVQSSVDLIEKLESFLVGETQQPHLYLTNPAVSTETSDESPLQTWIEQKNWPSLLKYWVQGGVIDWRQLYPFNNYQRIPLPTYPFRRDQVKRPVGIPGKHTPQTPNTPPIPIHPLLDRVCPSLQDAVFEKILNITDPLIAQHQVQGVGVLPGVAHLEMVRAASQLTCGQQVVGFTNVVWLMAIRIEADTQPVQLRLGKSAPNEVSFQILDVQEKGNQLSSKGQVHLADTPLTPQPPVNWQEIQTRCDYTCEGTEIYELFEQRSILYGPLFKRLDKVAFNRQEALATVRPLQASSSSEWGLDPAILDGGLHCLCAFLIHQDAPSETLIPFSVGKIELFGSLERLTYAYARRLDSGESSPRFEITLLDQHGQVLMKFHDFCTREWSAVPQSLESLDSVVTPSVRPELNIHPHLYYQPVWREFYPSSSINNIQPHGQLLICTHRSDLGLGQAFERLWGESQTTVVDLEQDLQVAGYENLLRSLPQLKAIVFLGGMQSRYYSSIDLAFFDQLQEISSIQLFRILKALSLTGKEALSFHVITNNTQTVISGDRPYNIFAGALDGLIRAAAHELPKLRVTSVDVIKADVEARLAEFDRNWLIGLIQTPERSTELCVARRGDRCWIRALERLEPTHSAPLPLRTQGVYLLVGGAGGIGLEISRYLATHYQAHLIWVGRRPRQQLDESQVQAIEQLGATVTYFQADVSDSAAMQRVVQQVRTQWGRLHGVLHTAIVLEDQAIYAMEEATFRRVLAPKARGTVVLSEVLEAEVLDLMIFFSSAITFTAAPGQSNYVAGCSFQDSFAQFLHKRKCRPVRIINWGYWGDTGVVANDDYRQRMAALGVDALTTSEGIQAFEQILKNPATQVMVIKLARQYLQQLGVNFTHQRQVLSQQTTSVLQPAVAAARAFQQQVSERNVDLGSQSLPRIEQLGRQLLISAFQRMGLDLQVATRYRSSELRERLGIVPSHHSFFHAALCELQQAGVIKLDGESVEVYQWPEAQGLRAEIVITAQRLVQDYPDAAASVNLLCHCSEHYPQVLTGEQSAVDVLFPRGTTDQVDTVYAHNRRADYFNELIGKGIAAAVNAKLKDGQNIVRILEVGAGTGGTACQVLPCLQSFEDQVEYVYTDISLKLVQQGEHRFQQDFPFTTYQVLDIEQAPKNHGFDVGDYDIVIATNVLHATSNIRHTLEYGKSLLKAKGLIVINELTRATTFATLTFGLTDGWWLFADPVLRLPNSPLLSKDSWQQILSECGFMSVENLGVTEEIDCDQAVFWAESDGCIQQPSEEIISTEGYFALKQSAITPQTRYVQPNGGTTKPQEQKQSISLNTLASLIAEVLKMSPDDLEPDVTFERYGVDSLVAMDIINRLEDEFGNLRKDLLFTYSTLETLADYLSQKIGRQTSSIQQEQSPTSPPTADKAPPVEEHYSWPSASATPSNLSQKEDQVSDAIAIIGLNGRFPGAETLHQFWLNLQAGHCSIRSVPDDRWDHRLYYDPSGEKPGTSYSQWAGFLDGVDEFDPLLFNISPREAGKLDPQERLFLQAAWAAVEDAGYTRDSLRRYATPLGIGVFAGVMHSAYQLIATDQWHQGNYTQAHSAHWSVANRVSHVLDLQGPSLAIDTACSSALTAIHLACESIRRGECRAALAGGVNLILHPSHAVSLSGLQMVSKSSQPRPFSKDADGLVPGEGVGVVLIKSLADAIQDNDHIYGVIRASCLNTDSRQQDYTAPDQTAQVRLLSNSLQRAGISPQSISYIEAQAVGSPLGDKAEIAALRQIFRNRKQPLKVGSVKPNIGHLEAASGMAQLFKVLLQFKSGMLLPTLVNDPLHPDITAASADLQIQRTLAPWPQVNMDGIPEPRRAGISSFGAGGANTHLIVEEYLQMVHAEESVEPERTEQLLVLSARKPVQLKQYGQRLLDYVQQMPSLCVRELADLAYTLQVGREPQVYRLAIWAHTVSDFTSGLRAYMQSLPAQNWVAEKVQKQFQNQPLNPSMLHPISDLAQAWVKGHPINWESLHLVGHRKRMSLPTYPFARDRYWLMQDAQTTTASKEEQQGWIEPSISPLGVSVVGASNIKQMSFKQKVTTPASVNSKDHDPSPSLEPVLLRMMAEILALSPSDIDPEESLGDYGFDSISLSEFSRHISDRWELEFSPTLFFQYPTLRQLSAYLEQTYPDIAITESYPISEPPEAQPEETITDSFQAMPKTTPNTSLPQQVMAQAQQEPIAVIGMSGIFPNSSNLRDFWLHLTNKDDMIREIPADRFDWKEIYGDALREPGKTNSKWGAFISGVDHFDPDFFNISPREARLMDPQQRLFLKTVWHTIEDAGYAPSQISGTRTSLFVGVAGHDYASLIDQSGVEVDGQVATGNTHSVLANRVSYLLNLRGPSEPIDTACSSSLVAVHRAVRSIQMGESDLAIAGGVNLLLTPTGFLAFGKSGMLSNDGRCKTFDESADGYVRGEGVGAILLKPLSTAQADGDHIYGLIRGSAVNHGGKAQSLTAPHSGAQAEVIKAALEQANVTADTLSYIEVHGTGTPLGDPVEINGLKQVFPASTGAQCGLGTVKTNIGHLETAAGIAGLIKLLLSLHHKTLPGLVNFTELNHHIQLADSPFYLVKQTQPWEQHQDSQGREIPRRAGVSSFGFGGVNAHVVVEEWANPQDQVTTEQPQLVVLSAQNEHRLQDYVDSMVDFLEQTIEDNRLRLEDISYTLQVGREEMNYRLAVIAQNCHELLEIWQRFRQGESPDNCWSGEVDNHSQLVQMLNADESHRQYLNQLIREKQLARIATLWTSGFKIDWSVLNQRNQRISLPTYPFAKERYWIKTTELAKQLPSHEKARSGTQLEITAQTTPTVSSPSVITSPGSSPRSTSSEQDARLQPVHVNGNSNRAHRALASDNIVEATQRTSSPIETPPQVGLTLADVRQAVLQVLAEFLSLNPADIKDEQELVYYGVDSIAGLRIMQRIQDIFGDDVPMMVIVEEPTLARLTKYLFENHGKNRLGTTRDLSQQQNIIDRSVNTFSLNHHTKVESSSTVKPPPRSPLIPFQPKGNTEWLVGVHSITGETSWLMPLALSRGNQHPSYGLEAPCFEQLGQQAETLESLARFYGQELINACGEQEVSLVGHGFGAVLAFEIASHLIEQAHPVTRLYMLNPLIPGQENSNSYAQQLQQDQTQRLLFTAQHFGALWGAPKQVTDEWINQAGTHLEPSAAAHFLTQHAQPPLSDDALVDWLQKSDKSICSLLPLMSGYQPQKLQTPITDTCLVLSPSNQYDNTFWPQWFEGEIRVHTTPHDIFDLLCPRSLTKLYARLTTPSGRAGSTAEKGGTAVSAHRWDPAVVMINRNGNQMPSFWLHTMLGDVSYGLNLSHYLGIDYPLFGLEQFDDKGQIFLLPTLKDMAAAHIEAIKRVQPQGPYRLGGYSFGGVVAFEVARQMQEVGETVSHLLLIDSFMPGTPVFDSIDTQAVGDGDFELMALIQIGNSLGNRWKATHYILIDDLVGKETKEQFEQVAYHLYEHSETQLDYSEIFDLVSSTYETIITNNDALTSYIPGKLSASTQVLLFRATDGFVGPNNDNGVPEVKVKFDDHTNGFGSFVESTIEIHDIAADHYTICRDEFIKEVAQGFKNSDRTSAV